MIKYYLQSLISYWLASLATARRVQFLGTAYLRAQGLNCVSFIKYEKVVFCIVRFILFSRHLWKWIHNAIR